MNKLLTLILIFALTAANASAQVQCETAGQLMNLSDGDFSKLCSNVLKLDPACKKVADDKRMSCSSKAQNEIFSSSELAEKAYGCVKGFIWDSTVELIKFLSSLLQGYVDYQINSTAAMFKFLTDEKYRDEAIAASEKAVTKGGKLGASFLKSSAQYLVQDYKDNYVMYTLNPAAAIAQSLARPLKEMMVKAAEGIIAEYVPQYECMNGAAKLNTLCKLAGDVLMPPVFVLAYLKNGATGLKALAKTQGAKIDKLKASFSSLNEATNSGKAASLEVDYAKMSPDQATSAVRAEQLAKAPPAPAPVKGADYTAKLTASVHDAAGGAKAAKANPDKYLDDIQKHYNEQMTKKFPELDFLLKDPDQFVKTMENRFEAQKKLTPKDPYLFDYSEVGMPMLKYIEKGIADKIKELSDIKLLIESGKAPKKMMKTYPIEELKTNLAFLQDLSKETAERLKTGKINYKDTVELSGWFSQAAGNFDTRQLPIYQRSLLSLDRAIEAHIEHPIADEYARYKKREFVLFEPNKVSISSGYEKAGPVYEKAVKDKEKLGVLLVPSHVEIDCDVLLRLGSREKVSIVGVTTRPILADGFNRPSYDFWLHDVRHETVKYMRKTEYLDTHKIPAAQADKVSKRMDAWSIELQNEIQTIKDPDLKRAAELIVFNFHHDRGYPVTPSQYVKSRSGKQVEYLLQGILTVSGQGSQVKNPLNIKKASKWLEEYWLKKVPEEEEFLKSLK